MQYIKAQVRKLLHQSGWDLYRLASSPNTFVQLLKCLNLVEANLFFDIGANDGYFAQTLRSVGFTGHIVSFEPLTEAHSKLSKTAARDTNWSVHSRIAIGDRDGETEINIAGNSVSSSVLPMLEAHSSAAVESAYIASESVPLARLDSIAEKYLQPDSNLFIKIDTQGYEWQVLDGAKETLKRAKGVLCELSLVPLYEGQQLWRDIIDRLETEGFTLWAIQKGFTDPRTGRSLQIDAIFLRID